MPMRLLLIILVALPAWLFALHTTAISATAAAIEKDTLSPGQTLTGDGKLVSSNGKFALGFFHISIISNSTPDNHNNTDLKLWHLGIWFNKVPKLTPVWVASRENPIQSPISPELKFSGDGANLAVVNLATNSTVWSTQITTQTNTTTTILVLLSNGNLILRNSDDNILWQSFDHPTDTLLPGATIALNKITGETRRLVSRRSNADQSPGVYSMEIGRDGVVRMLWNSTVPYWSSGEWINGGYFSSVPEMTAHHRFNFTFVNNDRESSFAYQVLDESSTMYSFVDVSGQRRVLSWHEGRQDWVNVFTHPNDQCEVHAVCGPFAVCNDNTLLSCSCMKGFVASSVGNNWDLDDPIGGCRRNTSLEDCGGGGGGDRNGSNGDLGDRFYAMTRVVALPFDTRKIGDAASAAECEKVCLGLCSCTAYSFGTGGCSVWHGELLNVKQLLSDGASGSGKTLYIRLAATEFQARRNNRPAVSIVGLIAACSATLSFLAVIIVVLIVRAKRNKRKLHFHNANNINNIGGGLIPFKYRELQRATRNFSEKIGAGGFGVVFKGMLNESTAIAVKRLYGSYHEEKQFRAEVSSVGIIHHNNLVKMIGFCCEGEKRFLVYEYMSNGSLDAHLFRNDASTLNWKTRYQIALGIARGLAYLHESCRDHIIHCDIKPQNILLDGSFVPKIADFGMAKLIGRDCSRVVTTARGTIGYLAPEWFSGMAITPKIDVYSYGMVLFEIISGWRNTDKEHSCDNDDDDVAYFPVQIARKLLEGNVMRFLDHRLNGDAIFEEVERACKVACWCIQDKEFDRPMMSKVVQILEGLVDVDMPPMPRLIEAITQR
uniref:Receptor-like serine/threonine-protein kinase n=1 Tax=Leersia perrieri TaxID=77586 RepID=A0A0D9W4V3_9ORYZ